MYVYLENNYFIPLSEIVAVVDYEKFAESEISKEFFAKNKNNIINFNKDDKRTIIVTDKYIYITSYTGRAIYSRGHEFTNIKKRSKINRKK